MSRSLLCEQQFQSETHPYDDLIPPREHIRNRNLHRTHANHLIAWVEQP